MDVQDGAPWRDLPECYGKWITVCRRFNRWSGNGAMERLFTALQEERIIAVEIRVPAPGLHEREGPPARHGRPEKKAAVSRRLPGRAERQSPRDI